MRLSSARLAVVTCLIASSAGAAERVDTVTPSRAVVREACILAPPTATASERTLETKESGFGDALLPLGGKLLGDLASAGLTILGDRIAEASAEHGFLARGAATFALYRTRLPAGARKTANLEQPRKCLILYTPGVGGDLAALKDDAGLKAAQAGQPADATLTPFDDDVAKDLPDAFAAIGLTVPPAVYVEAELWPIPDGMVLRPVLVWYRQALPKAPAKAAPVELHATFAIPSNAAPIGGTFAVAQIKLPPMAPGSAMGPRDLFGRGIVALPARASTGAAADAVTAANLLYTAKATAQTERDQANASLTRASNRYVRSKKPEDKEAAVAAKEILDTKEALLLTATTAAAGVAAQDAGSTNVQLDFVVVRDANKLGLAIGTALKARSTDLNTAVTNALTPKADAPAWSPNETTYLQAMVNIDAKARERDIAAGTGDAAAFARLDGELLILRAKANEAAVTAQRALPYPGLLTGR